MTERALPSRAIVKLSPSELLQRLPGLGPVMVVSRVNGATHERIGPVEDVIIRGGEFLVRGKRHDSRIDPTHLEAVYLESSGGAHGKLLPKLSFLDHDGETVFSVIGMEGTDAFFPALDGVVFEELPADTEKLRMPTGEVASDDPGAVPLNAAVLSKLPIVIAVEQPGFSQSWQGIVGEVKPAMSFLNIMTEDFHLHLKGGAVGRWIETVEGAEIILSAEDSSGKAMGFILRGPRAAFGLI